MHNEKLCIAVVAMMLLAGCASENASKYSQAEYNSSDIKVSLNTEKTFKNAIAETHAKVRNTNH